MRARGRVEFVKGFATAEWRESLVLAKSRRHKPAAKADPAAKAGGDDAAAKAGGDDAEEEEDAEVREERHELRLAVREAVVLVTRWCVWPGRPSAPGRRSARSL